MAENSNLCADKGSYIFTPKKSHTSHVLLCRFLPPAALENWKQDVAVQKGALSLFGKGV